VRAAEGNQFVLQRWTRLCGTSVKAVATGSITLSNLMRTQGVRAQINELQIPAYGPLIRSASPRLSIPFTTDRKHAARLRTTSSTSAEGATNAGAEFIVVICGNHADARLPRSRGEFDRRG